MANRQQAITWTNDDPVYWRIYAALGGDELIHRGRVTRIWISKLGRHRYKQWLDAYTVPNHCLNQWWLNVNWILGKKFQLNQITKVHNVKYCWPKLLWHTIFFPSLKWTLPMIIHKATWGLFAKWGTNTWWVPELPIFHWTNILRHI